MQSNYVLAVALALAFLPMIGWALYEAWRQWKIEDELEGRSPEELSENKEKELY